MTPEERYDHINSMYETITDSFRLDNHSFNTNVIPNVSIKKYYDCMEVCTETRIFRWEYNGITEIQKLTTEPYKRIFCSVHQPIHAVLGVEKYEYALEVLAELLVVYNQSVCHTKIS